MHYNLVSKCRYRVLCRYSIHWGLQVGTADDMPSHCHPVAVQCVPTTSSSPHARPPATRRVQARPMEEMDPEIRLKFGVAIESKLEQACLNRVFIKFQVVYIQFLVCCSLQTSGISLVKPFASTSSVTPDIKGHVMFDESRVSESVAENHIAMSTQHTIERVRTRRLHMSKTPLFVQVCGIYNAWRLIFDGCYLHINIELITSVSAIVPLLYVAGSKHYWRTVSHHRGTPDADKHCSKT